VWNEPSPGQLAEIPRLYATENTPLEDKLIYLHFFIFDCDWYVAEYDGGDLFWGFGILNEDYLNAEWGYISFRELKTIKIPGVFEMDCDLHWRIRPAREVYKIAKAHCHWKQ
jgi:hypothetical protein